LIDDSFNLARADYLDFGIALSLLKYLKHETELVPLTAGFKVIDFLLSYLDEQTFFDKLREIFVTIVDDVYANINNSSHVIKPEDENYHDLTKLHVNYFACRVGAKSCLKAATSKLFLFDFEYNFLNINERPALYCGGLGEDLASFNWVQLKKKLMKANGNEEFYRDNQEEFDEIFNAMSACDSNLNRVERLLNDIFINDVETFDYENVSKENVMQVVENLIKTSSAHRNLFMNFFAENFDAVNEK
jgi:hypothetical protein